MALPALDQAVPRSEAEILVIVTNRLFGRNREPPIRAGKTLKPQQDDSRILYELGRKNLIESTTACCDVGQVPIEHAQHFARSAAGRRLRATVLPNVSIG